MKLSVQSCSQVSTPRSVVLQTSRHRSRWKGEPAYRIGSLRPRGWCSTCRKCAMNGWQSLLDSGTVKSRIQGCNLWRNWFKLPPFCLQPVAALGGCQQRPDRWRTEVLDFCTGSHKSSSFTRRKSRTSNNPVPVLRISSKYDWMSCSPNESNLTRLRHKLQPCYLVCKQTS